VIGVDEIAIGAGHSYRIVVSDLLLGRPVWFGGTDRSEARLDLFYAWLGPEKSAPIRLAVMDMGKALRNAPRKQGNAPQALIVFDKFHVLRHLQTALAEVRESESARLTGAGRRYIKGQKYALLSRWHNLSVHGKTALKQLPKVNKRLHTAYLLKESCGQLRDYETPGWALRFFERWCESLKWQRLKPYQKFAAMVANHWEGIAAYCQTNNKDGLDRTVAAALADEEGKALGVERVVGQPVEAFGGHAATPPTADAADGEGQIDTLIATGEVTDPSWPLIVEARESLATDAARRFFSAAAQGQQDGLGIALEAVDTSRGDETREAVQVEELLWGWHRPIVTTFLGQEKVESQAFSQVSKEFGCKIYPLDFKKSQNLERVLLQIP
jgi:hypothetical protein